MAQEQARIQAQNAALMRPQPISQAPPRLPCAVAPPPPGSDLQRQALERQYLEARAALLNTKYLPPGAPPRWTADSVRGAVGTGMPLPPEMMTRNAMFNPVLQKAQQAEQLRQQLQNYPR